MPDVTDPTSPGNFGDDPEGIVKRWSAEIEHAQKQDSLKKWTTRGDKIIKRYRDEREQDSFGNNVNRKLNILWSNIETLQPALYAQMPQPVVQRRFKDADPVGRVASELLERDVSASIEMGNFDDTMRAVRDDYLLVGRGVPWVQYDAAISEQRLNVTRSEEGLFGEDGTVFEDSDIEEDDDGLFFMERTVEDELADLDHVFWKDFLHKPARNWKELKDGGWVARRHFLNRKKLVKRFGEIGKKVPLTKTTDSVKEKDEGKSDFFKTAEVWEVWDASENNAIWISTDFKDEPLDIRPDPLGLQGFFPCPRPAYGTLTSDSLIPVPDYAQYQDQAQEIDELTERIALLTSALKVAGVYDGAAEGVGQLLDRRAENELIKVDNWAAFAEKGGLKGAVDFLPIDTIANVIVQLIDKRQVLKQDLFEVSGISDILRGQVDPREKLGQSRIKGQFATLRLDDQQREIQRVAKDCIRMIAEIIAEQFDPETMMEMANLRLPTDQEKQQAQAAAQEGLIPPEAVQDILDQPSIDDVMGLLRQDRLRSFRIDIETDSTIAVDEEADRARVVELISNVATFLEQAIPVVQQAPQLLPFFAEMLKFAFRRFRAGRQLENVLEDAMDKLTEAASQPREEGPDPEEEKIASNERIEGQKIQANVAMKGAELQSRERTAALDREAGVETAALDRDAQIESNILDIAARPQTVGQ